jgi:spore coat protein A
MHFHLFNVRVLSREPMAAVKAYAGGIPATKAGRGPDWNEMGWKETVKAHPGEVTTVLVLVEHPLPGGVRTVDVSGQVPDPAIPGAFLPFGPFTGNLPQSPRLAAMGAAFAGDEYVWHCHILEHEEHDMMRPLVGN